MLRERRLTLVTACEADRRDLAAAFRGVRRELDIADRVVRVGQRLTRHKAVVGILVAGLVVAPVLAAKWIRRAAWWLPIVIQGYRMIRSSRGERRAPGESTS